MQGPARAKAIAFVAVTFVALVRLAPFFVSGFAEANHVAPASCGVKQASFARICRAGAYNSCVHAAARGVTGFRPAICAQRETACRSCLDQLRGCIANIGHARRMDYSCDECTGKFSRCIGRRYPKLKS